MHCCVSISTGVLGHEFLGVVEDVDDGLSITRGQRVTGEINLACQNCSVCDIGGIEKRNHCPERSVLGIKNKDGVFAEYITIPTVNLYPIPEAIEDACAVFAEPLAAAFRIGEQGVIDNTKKVAVLGDGKLGLLIAQVVLSLQPRELTVFGKHATKLNLLPDAIQTFVLDAATTTTFENKFDVVVDATGNPEGFKMAMTLTRPLGVIVLKSTCALGSEINTASIVVKEIRIVGSRCGNYDMALNALECGRICPDNLISKVYPFSKALDALTQAAQSGVLKIQMVFEEN
jgi:threonine dehydrogenase-like Zn-dependent dehydrogenase